MIPDPIVEEIRKIREAHAARFDHDLDRIYADLMEKEKHLKNLVYTGQPGKLPQSPEG